MNQMTTLDAQLAAQAVDVHQVIQIIAAQAMLDAAQITPQTALADLALDSLVMVEIVFALEEAFGLTIPFNANTKTAVGAEFDMSTPTSIAAAIAAANATAIEPLPTV